MTAAVEWNRETINDLLIRNPRAVERALVMLHDRQTAAEQGAGLTTDANGVGFGAFDAPIFSSFALWVKRGRSLSQKQLAICIKTNKHGIARIAKYWQQIGAAIAEKQAIKQPAQDALDEAMAERVAEKTAFAWQEKAAERAAFVGDAW